MAGGRPTTYSDEVIEKACDYAENFERFGDVIPTVVGLCGVIERSKSTVYKWCKEQDKREFSDIVRKIEEIQEKTLISGGLSNSFNASISKLLLTKHGYSDKQEIDHKTDGDKITGLSINFVDPKKDGEG